MLFQWAQSVVVEAVVELPLEELLAMLHSSSNAKPSARARISFSAASLAANRSKMLSNSEDSSSNFAAAFLYLLFHADVLAGKMEVELLLPKLNAFRLFLFAFKAAPMTRLPISALVAGLLVPSLESVAAKRTLGDAILANKGNTSSMMCRTREPKKHLETHWKELGSLVMFSPQVFPQIKTKKRLLGQKKRLQSP